MMSKRETEELIERYCMGQLTPEELRIFEEWRDSDPDLAQAIDDHRLITDAFLVYAERSNLKKKLNKKMYRAGISVIFSQLIRDQRLLVTDNINVDTHKTKEFLDKIKNLGLNEVMVITHELNDNLYLASRNIPRVAVIEVKNVDPVNLLKFEKILITTEGLKKIEESLV